LTRYKFRGSTQRAVSRINRGAESRRAIRKLIQFKDHDDRGDDDPRELVIERRADAVLVGRPVLRGASPRKSTS